jgi:hypothetical protein
MKSKGILLITPKKPVQIEGDSLQAVNHCGGFFGQIYQTDFKYNHLPHIN